MIKAPTINRQPSGSPKYITPKEAVAGTSTDIITLTLGAGIETKALLMESWAPTEKMATAASPIQPAASPGKKWTFLYKQRPKAG